MSRWIDLTPYAGSKKDKAGRKYSELYFDDCHYETCISLFGGMCAIGGTMIEQGKCDRLIIAESEASVRAVWMTWADPSLHEPFYEGIEYWKSELRDSPEAAGVTLKQFIFEAIQGEIELKGSAIAQVAAAQIAYRRLGFMAISRMSTDKINVWLDCRSEVNDEGLIPVTEFSGKLSALLRLNNWRFPPVKPGAIVVVDDWSKCFEQAYNPASTVVIHDPPYYWTLDEERDAEIMKKRKLKDVMAPCYVDHKPHDEVITLQGLCVEPLKKSLNCKRVVLSNYDDHKLQAAIDALGVPYVKTITGVLDHGNNAIEAVTGRNEAVWEFGAQRELKIIDEQLSLLEVAA